MNLLPEEAGALCTVHVLANCVRASPYRRHTGKAVPLSCPVPVGSMRVFLLQHMLTCLSQGHAG